MSWPHALQHGFALSFGVGCGSGTEGAKSNYNKIVKPDVLGKLEINFSKNSLRAKIFASGKPA